MIDQRGWVLTDHVCRHCLGRVVERNSLFMCSSCETKASLKPNALCGCGMRGSNGVHLPGTLKSIFRCGPNPSQGPSSPARFCILYGDTPVDPLDVAAH